MLLDPAHELAVSMRIIMGKSMDECGGVNGRWHCDRNSA